MINRYLKAWITAAVILATSGCGSSSSNNSNPEPGNCQPANEPGEEAGPGHGRVEALDQKMINI